MENMENLYFDPSTGKLCKSRPSNDKAIALDMNKQGSGGFFAFHSREPRNDRVGRNNNVVGHVTLECAACSAELSPM